jgi:hypothetical protein
MPTVSKFVKYQSLPSRSAAVDFTGREFNRNRLIALMAAIVLEEVRLIFSYLRPSFFTVNFCVYMLLILSIFYFP